MPCSGQNVVSPALGGGFFTPMQVIALSITFLLAVWQAPDGSCWCCFGWQNRLRHAAAKRRFFPNHQGEFCMCVAMCVRPLCCLAIPPHTHLRDKEKREEKQPHVSQRRRCAYLDRVRMLGEEAIASRQGGHGPSNPKNSRHIRTRS